MATTKVMTFNIRYGTARDGKNHWSLRRDLVFRTLDAHQPDIIGLQEALPFQLDQINAALPGYAEVGMGRDGERTGEHASILFRADRFLLTTSDTFWFSQTPHVPGSRHWGNRHARICTWVRLIDRATGQAFYCYNLHLDHWSQQSRIRSVELLVERLIRRGSQDPVVVTGDFNAGERNRIVRFLNGSAPLEGGSARQHTPFPLADAFRTVHPDRKQVGTFNKFWGHRSGNRIDHVLVSREWSVSDAAIISESVKGRYPSDHFPVMAVLELPVKTAEATTLLKASHAGRISQTAAQRSASVYTDARSEVAPAKGRRVANA